MVERDWYRIVTTATCDECGQAPTDPPREELAAHLERLADDWGRFLRATSDGSLRSRPSAAVWSPLEYACHVRDATRVFGERVRRIDAEDRPELGWWDHEAEVSISRYNEQDPVLVAEALSEATSVFVEVLVGTPGSPGAPAGRDTAGWERTGVRRAGEVFSVEGLARFLLHESRHHLHDAEARRAGA